MTATSRPVLAITSIGLGRPRAMVTLDVLNASRSHLACLRGRQRPAQPLRAGDGSRWRGPVIRRWSRHGSSIDLARGLGTKYRVRGSSNAEERS